jgi:hypothetical protein
MEGTIQKHEGCFAKDGNLGLKLQKYEKLPLDICVKVVLFIGLT